MLRNKQAGLFAIYGSMLALAFIGVLLESAIYIVVIVGLFTAALIAVYGQMNSAARETMSESKRAVQLKVILSFLICSFIGFMASYFFFGNLGFSGVMLGTAAACAHMLVRPYSW